MEWMTLLLACKYIYMYGWMDGLEKVLDALYRIALHTGASELFLRM